jgi:hypothetical protein
MIKTTNKIFSNKNFPPALDKLIKAEKLKESKNSKLAYKISRVYRQIMNAAEAYEEARQDLLKIYQVMNEELKQNIIPDENAEAWGVNIKKLLNTEVEFPFEKVAYDHSIFEFGPADMDALEFLFDFSSMGD